MNRLKIGLLRGGKWEYEIYSGLHPAEWLEDSLNNPTITKITIRKLTTDETSKELKKETKQNAI